MKKKIYTNLFMDNNIENMTFQKRVSDSPAKQNLRYSNKLSNVANDNSAKFSSQSKDVKKFSSTNVQDGNKIEDVYTNLNFDLLVNNSTIKNLNSVGMNVNQSININDTKNILGGNEMNLSKFNSSSPIAKENTSAMIPKLNMAGSNKDNLLDDLSFLNNISQSNRKNSNRMNDDMNNLKDNTNNLNLNLNFLNPNNNHNLTNLNSTSFNNFGNNTINNNKSVELNPSDNLRNFNSSNSQNSEMKRSLDLLNNNLTNILNSQKIEDIFNHKSIKNQLRGTVMV